MAAFGITQSRQLCDCLHWFTFRKLLVLNCAVLLLNVLFYVENFDRCPSTFVDQNLCSSTVEVSPSRVKVQSFSPSTVGVQRVSPSTVEVQHFSPSTIKVQRFSPSTVKVQSFSLSTVGVQRFSPSTVEVQRFSPSTVKVQSFSPSTVEDHFLTPLEPEQRALLDMTFQAFTEAMDSNNVTYFVDGGTLLGSWRHHDLIPWDDDIDVLVNASDRQEVSRVLRTKDPASFGLYDWAESGKDYIFQWKFYPLSGHSFHGGVYKTPYIDVFFYLENETHIWNASPYFSNEIFLKSHVFPLNRRPFGNLMVPTPCNPEAFVGDHYNVSMCKSRTYNHIYEAHMPNRAIQVPCSRLVHLYPFVHRENTASNGSEEFVLEKLMFKNSTLRQFKARKSC